MPNDVTCSNCGERIRGEPPICDAIDQRSPCAKCGSRNRTISGGLRSFSAGWSRMRPTVITYPQRLLGLARNLIDRGNPDTHDFDLAVILLHMASEVATERALSKAFAAKGLGYLEDWATSTFSGYSLNNRRIRDLYAALTGDKVQDQTAFWSDFAKSCELRNGVMHRGAHATDQDAEASYQACCKLVAHLKG